MLATPILRLAPNCCTPLLHAGAGGAARRGAAQHRDGGAVQRAGQPDRALGPPVQVRTTEWHWVHMPLMVLGHLNFRMWTSSAGGAGTLLPNHLLVPHPSCLCAMQPMSRSPMRSRLCPPQPVLLPACSVEAKMAPVYQPPICSHFSAHPTPPPSLLPLGRSVEAKIAMLVEAPAAVEDALASLLDHPEPLVQVRGGVVCGAVGNSQPVVVGGPQLLVSTSTINTPGSLFGTGWRRRQHRFEGPINACRTWPDVACHRPQLLP